MSTPTTAAISVLRDIVVNVTELREVRCDGYKGDFTLKLYYKNISDPVVIPFGACEKARVERDCVFDKIREVMRAHLKIT